MFFNSFYCSDTGKTLHVSGAPATADTATCGWNNSWDIDPTQFTCECNLT